MRADIIERPRPRCSLRDSRQVPESWIADLDDPVVEHGGHHDLGVAGAVGVLDRVHGGLVRGEHDVVGLLARGAVRGEPGGQPPAQVGQAVRMRLDHRVQPLAGHRHARDGQDRDVVGQVVVQVGDDPLARVLGRRERLGEACRQPVDPEIDDLPAPLHEPVGVEQQRVAEAQRHLGLGVAVRHRDAERVAEALGDPLDGAVGAADQRRRVPGVGEAQQAGVRVEDPAQARRHRQVPVGDEQVEAIHQRGRRVALERVARARPGGPGPSRPRRARRARRRRRS